MMLTRNRAKSSSSPVALGISMTRLARSSTRLSSTASTMRFDTAASALSFMNLRPARFKSGARLEAGSSLGADPSLLRYIEDDPVGVAIFLLVVQGVLVFRQIQ